MVELLLRVLGFDDPEQAKNFFFENRIVAGDPPYIYNACNHGGVHFESVYCILQRFHGIKIFTGQCRKCNKVFVCCTN